MKRNHEEGQAITEYLLIVSIIAFLGISVSKAIEKSGIAENLQKLLTGPFSSAYRYGHIKAKGYDDGGPDNHPRAYGGNNFRIFILDEKL